jgi:hypothetical protein
MKWKMQRELVGLKSWRVFPLSVWVAFTIANNLILECIFYNFLHALVQYLDLNDNDQMQTQKVLRMQNRKNFLSMRETRQMRSLPFFFSCTVHHSSITGNSTQRVSFPRI